MRRAVAALVALLALLAAGPAPVRASEGAAMQVPTAAPAQADSLGGAAAPEPPAVTARGAVLWDPADDLVLHGLAHQEPRPMASTTKIMTTLLAIEAGAVGDTVTVSATAAAVGEATLDLQPGQQLPMRSLLAGLLLRSGNDAATALAEHVSGDEASFVARMNARATELGLGATRFVNPTGLTDDPGHHASPLDLARLAEHAMAHPVFAEYAGARTADVPGLPAMTSRNELLGSYPGATGVKTGYTGLAGLCLVASASRQGRTLYAVVLGSEDSFADAAALLDHGFSAFRRPQPVAAGTPVTPYRWADAEVDLLAEAALAATVPAHGEATWRTVLEPDLERPLPEGTPAGTAQLLVDGEVRAEAPLLTAADVGAPADVAPAAGAGGAVQEALRAFARTQAVDRAA